MIFYLFKGAIYMALKLYSFGYTFDTSGVYKVSVDFFNTVNTADVALKGIESAYNTHTSHNINRFIFKAYNVSIDPGKTKVNFDIQYEQSDKGNNKTSGEITLLVIADIDSKTQQEPTYTISSPK